MGTNAEAAIRFLQTALAGQPDYDALTPDSVWWVPGHPDMPMVPFLENLPKLFPNGGRLDITGVTEQGDRVALEAASSFDFPDGRNYSNQYHFLVEMSGGKIRAVREYCDTVVAQRFFGSGG